MNTKVLFSSNKSDWETPPELFRNIDTEFRFTLDVCATAENTKLPKFFSLADDSLKQDWQPHICWMNPPYGRGISTWIEKAAYSARMGATVVALLPSRTDTWWFHEWVYNKAETRFLRGRIKFVGAKHSAPFPSMLVIFRP